MAAGPVLERSHLFPASALLSTILGVSLIYGGKKIKEVTIKHLTSHTEITFLC